MSTNQFDTLIPELKKQAAHGKPAPFGLSHGLTLRLTKLDGGLFQLVMWRDKKPPSLQEVDILMAAIRRLDDPLLIVRSEIETSHDGQYKAYRVWWFTGAVTVSWLQPAQKGLFDGTAEGNQEDNGRKQRHNYEVG